jgi:hypothetical protein
MSKFCAVLGVFGALALPSAAFAVPGPPPAPPGCATAAAHTAGTPGFAAVDAHCPDALPPA